VGTPAYTTSSPISSPTKTSVAAPLPELSAPVLSSGAFDFSTAAALPVAAEPEKKPEKKEEKKEEEKKEEPEEKIEKAKAKKGARKACW